MRPAIPKKLVPPAALAVLALLLRPAPAAAQTVEDHSKRGVELYQAGEFAEAIEEMLKAYQLSPDAGLLYNVARIYEEMDETDLAVTYYKRFVTSDGADPERVKKALGRMKELKQARAEVDLPSPPPAQPATTPAQGPAPAPPPPAPPKEPLLATSTWGLLIGGVGVLVLAGGGAFGLMATADGDDVADSSKPYADRLQAQADARNHALLADVLIDAGAVAAVLGATLLLIGDDDGEEDEAGSASILPTPALGAATGAPGIVVRWALP